MRHLRIPICYALLTASVSTAQACSPSPSDPPQSQPQLFARASTVFVAHLLRTEEIAAATPLNPEPGPVVEATFQTIEVFKGQPPPDQRVRSPVFAPGNCSVPLLAGSDYLFFLYSADANFVLMLPGGSTLIWDVNGSATKEELGQLRKLAKKSP